MFTGIVEETGRVEQIDRQPDGIRLTIAAETVTETLAVGQSVSVSGVCLTAETVDPEAAFEVFLASETVERTYLGDLETGDSVNLERALPASGRFDGHIVQGHVDGVGQITDLTSVGDDWMLTVDMPTPLSSYVVEKGSIALDGISLTVAERTNDSVSVAIIPTTYEVTTLAETDRGDPVHVEVDIIAKYVDQLLE